MAAPRYERQCGAASDFINGKISGEEFQQCVQELIAARGGKAGINGASSMMEQLAKTLLNADFPVNPTEGCNVSGRRLSNFCKGEASGAAPVAQKDKV